MLYTYILVMDITNAVFVDRENRAAVEQGVPVAARTDLESVDELNAFVIDDEVVDMLVTRYDVLYDTGILERLEHTVISGIASYGLVLNADAIGVAVVPTIGALCHLERHAL